MKREPKYWELQEAFKDNQKQIDILIKRNSVISEEMDKLRHEEWKAQSKFLDNVGEKEKKKFFLDKVGEKDQLQKELYGAKKK